MNTWKQNKRKLMFELLRFMSYLWTELKCDEGRRLKQTLITCWGFVCIAFCNTWFSISNNNRTHWPLTANQIFPSPLLLLPIQCHQSGCSTPLFVAMWNFNFIYHNSIPALLHSERSWLWMDNSQFEWNCWRVFQAQYWDEALVDCELWAAKNLDNDIISFIAFLHKSWPIALERKKCQHSHLVCIVGDLLWQKQKLCLVRYFIIQDINVSLWHVSEKSHIT